MSEDRIVKSSQKKNIGDGVFQSYRRRPFTQVDSAVLGNTALTTHARFLITYFMSLPPNWKINRAHLAKICKPSLGRDSLSKVINELIEHKYLSRVQLRKDDGDFGEYVYTAYDIPYDEISIALIEKENLAVTEKPLAQDKANLALPGLAYTATADTVKPVSINNIYSNKKESIKKQQQLNTKSNPEKFAAVSSKVLEDADTLIGEELTGHQKIYTALKIEEIKGEGLDLTLCTEVFYALLDKKQFTNAGNDFLKKLNTILKMIKNKTWVTPAGMHEVKQKKENKAQQQKKVKLDELHGTLEQIKRNKEYAKKIDEKTFNFWCEEELRISQQLSSISQ